MSDEAVKTATGKSWTEWFAVLDAAGSVHREHTAIARWLADVEKVPPWWSQMVTVEYERARGLRQVHQTATGFEVSMHRTIDVPLHNVYVAWADDKKRATWLLGRGHSGSEAGNHTPGVKEAELMTTMQLTSTRLDKILHYKLANDTKLDVSTEHRNGKTRLAVAHTKLKKAADVEHWRAFWKAAIERLAKELA